MRKSEEELESYAGGAPSSGDKASKTANSDTSNNSPDAETNKMFESHEAELEKLTRKPAESEGFWKKLGGRPLDAEATRKIV